MSRFTVSQLFLLCLSVLSSFPCCPSLVSRTNHCRAWPQTILLTLFPLICGLQGAARIMNATGENTVFKAAWHLAEATPYQCAFSHIPDSGQCLIVKWPDCKDTIRDVCDLSLRAWNMQSFLSKWGWLHSTGSIQISYLWQVGMDSACLLCVSVQYSVCYIIHDKSL